MLRKWHGPGPDDGSNAAAHEHAMSNLPVCARTAAPSAVEVEAAIGTLVAVATRKIIRTERLLPETAFADQVSSCHGSHSNANSSATLPARLQLGLSTSSPTS